MKDMRMVVPTWLLVAVPTAVAAVANLLNIGRQSLWQDEGFTAQMATGSWSEFWRQVFSHSEGNMVGYYLLMRLWPFQADEAGLRSFSALCIVAAVPVVFWIGWRLGGRAAGWWSACFFAVWLYVVRYGQEARSYALLVLVSLAAVACLIEATRTRQRRWWVLYGALLGAGLYVHFFAALTVVAHLAWIVGKRPPRGLVALALGTAAVVAAPMLLYLAFNDPGSNVTWIQRPTLGSLWTDIVQPMTTYSYYVLAALLLAVLVMGLVALRTRDQRPTFALLVAWGSAPLLIALAYSLLAHPVLQAHYVITIVPAWILLIGIAVARIPVRTLSVVAGFLVLAFCVRSMDRYYSGFLKADLRGTAALISSQARPGDAVIALDGMQPALDYYWRDDTARPVAGGAGERLWVVADGDPLPPDEFAADWQLMSRTNLYGVAIGLYAP